MALTPMGVGRDPVRLRGVREDADNQTEDTDMGDKSQEAFGMIPSTTSPGRQNWMTEQMLAHLYLTPVLTSFAARWKLAAEKE